MYKNSYSGRCSEPSFTVALFVFIPVLFYPPFFFTEQIPAALRIAVFVLLITYFLLTTKGVSIKDEKISLILLVFTLSLLSVNYSDINGLRTAGSTLLTLLFAWAMYRAANMNERIKNISVRFYVGFFTLIPLCSVLSVIYLIAFGEYNVFNIVEGHDTYIYTPFGAVLEKNFEAIGVVYRSFSYFVEPVFLAFFCAANIFLVAPSLEKNSKYFLIANVIGGILTFSYLFYVLSFILLFSKKITSLSLKSSFFITFVTVLIAMSTQIGVFSSSSLSDRLERINYFFVAMENANIFQLMLGSGFALETGFDRGFSAGLFTSIYEIGIVNLMGTIFFVYILSNKNMYILLLFFIASLAFEPIKMPIFWVLVVVLSVL